MRGCGSTVWCGVVEWMNKEHPEIVWPYWKDGRLRICKEDVFE